METAISNSSGCPYCSGNKFCEHTSLAYLRPNIASEWDYKSPTEYPVKSGEKVWWVCSKNICGCHQWKTAISHRTSNKRGCPYCTNQKLCPHNNLEYLRPDMVSEWDYVKNKMPPSQYTVGSVKKAWWKCSEGHRWEAKINNRTGGTACPHCSMSGYSKAQIEWLDGIMSKENICIQYALDPEGEVNIPGVGKVDGYCEETGTVYEFHGDYWHGNPDMFDSDDKNTRTGKSFGELYRGTMERDQKIRDLGYHLIVKWETNFMGKT